MTYEDNLRLAGEIISILGALVILLLEVNYETCFIFTHTINTVNFTATSSFMSLLQHQQIPDILRVGAKRYFGQTALGGPFHVIL